MGFIILILNFGFPCLLFLCLSLPAFVPFLVCLCAFPCLPLCLSLPAFVPFLACLPLRLSLPAFAPFLACLCAFPWLPLCPFLPVFVPLCDCFQEVCINLIGVRSIPELTNGTRLNLFSWHITLNFTLSLLVHGFSPYDGNSILRVLEI
jgi:hypothetical protein